MLLIISRVLLGLAMFVAMWGTYEVTDGTPVLGWYLIGSAVSAGLLAALFDGLSRVLEALKRIEQKL